MALRTPPLHLLPASQAVTLGVSQLVAQIPLKAVAATCARRRLAWGAEKIQVKQAVASGGGRRGKVFKRESSPLGASINDVNKIFGFFDPLPLVCIWN